jgi:hypothetical protein
LETREVSVLAEYFERNWKASLSTQEIPILIAFIYVKL